MTIQKLNETEIKGITWARFLEMISTKYVMVTTDEWQTILASNITGIDNLLRRVTQLFDAKPIIGLKDNYVAFRTGVDFKDEALDDNWTWIPSTETPRSGTFTHVWKTRPCAAPARAPPSTITPAS